jgi:hypothetical protein
MSALTGPCIRTASMSGRPGCFETSAMRTSWRSSHRAALAGNAPCLRFASLKRYLSCITFSLKLGGAARVRGRTAL